MGQRFNFPNYTGVATAVTIIGFVILVSIGVYTGSRFSNEAKYTEITTLNEMNQDTISLVGQSNTLLDDYGWNQNFNWIIEGEEQFINRIQLNIEKSNNGEFLLETQKKSRGKTKSEARQNAKSIEYISRIDGQFLYLNDYLRLPKGQLFRDPSVELSLQIPQGKVIYLDENLYEILNYCELAPNSNHSDLVGNYWLMSDVGLMCISCKGVN